MVVLFEAIHKIGNVARVSR